MKSIINILIVPLFILVTVHATTAVPKAVRVNRFLSIQLPAQSDSAITNEIAAFGHDDKALHALAVSSFAMHPVSTSSTHMAKALKETTRAFGF